MGGTPLIARPLLDDDEDVRQVQEFAGAGARTGAKLGAIGGPVGAGVGAGFGSAAGFLLGYGLTGVDPSARRREEGDHEPPADVDGSGAADDHGDAGHGGHGAGGHGGHDRAGHDGPITIDVTDEADG
jgi:hypothetical protein